MTANHGEPSQRLADFARLRRLFGVFTAAHGPGRSLVYEAVCRAIVDDEALLGLLLEAPAEQQRPSLLFAAVNLLLAKERGTAAGTELVAYYPIHGGRRTVDDRLVPAFTAFCQEHRDELVGVMRERSTQTNEVRRCVALRLGVSHVQRSWPGQVALTEVGASAGLNLLFDHYSYRLGNQITTTPTDRSSVVVSCDVRGPAPDGLLAATPTVTRRLGIDRHPIDLTDPDARAWLAAFIWPEQVDELATLRGAIDLATTTGINVVTGDATTDTCRMLTALPGDEPVVVFTASLLSYLTASGRAAFVAQLDAAVRRRPVAWVFAEAPGLLASTGLDIPALRGALARRNDRYLVGARLRRADDSADDRLLAMADPYLRWIVAARHETDDFAWA